MATVSRPRYPHWLSNAFKNRELKNWHAMCYILNSGSFTQLCQPRIFRLLLHKTPNDALKGACRPASDKRFISHRAKR
ncbi:hypothetical protein EBL_c10090 [Shimwellia blattae DSM 4481 = NBRC 105725]|uniref:Uncharacterized protein n=1 Tax=Shimwellia blattae (strain ATCC 29907 / DSM 4481 / JCM 1650 / NBRC 105725 / CDC 9005-74) TaxID=630626 RepID=I2B6G5_SHIBC|nr:hypothetical protein EBL_c10090 [Shimwellia blattae DSM 4481 = NBRC 105725]